MPERNLPGFTQMPALAMADSVLRLSLAPSFTLGMAQLLSGRQDVHKLLTWLREQHFCDSDEINGEVRYTWAPPVRKFLRSRAKQVFLDEHVQGIEYRCVELFERRGCVEDAIDLLIEIENWSAALNVLYDRSRAWVDNGRCEQLLGLLERMRQGCQFLARFHYLRGVCLFLNAPKQALPAFKRALVLAQHQSDANTVAECLMYINALTVMLLRDPHACVSLSVGTGALIVPRTGARPAKLAHYAALLYSALYRPTSHRTLAHATVLLERLVLTEKDALQRGVAAIAVLASFCIGGLLERARLFRHAVEPLMAEDKNPPLVRGWWSLLCAVQSTLEGDLQLVTPSLEKARNAFETLGQTRLEPIVAFLQCYAALASGNHALAGESLQACACWSRGPDKHTLATVLLFLGRACVASRLDRPGEALVHAQNAVRFARGNGLLLVRFFASLVHAHCLLQNGNAEAASRALILARDKAEHHGGDLLIGQILLQEAVQSTTKENPIGIEHLLKQIFRISRCQRIYPFPPYWPPSVLSRICLLALEQGVETDFVTSFIHRQNIEAPRHDPMGAWPWPIKVITFGSFQLYHKGEPVEFTGKAQRKPLELLKAIIAYGCKGVDVPLLATMLWPEAGGDAAQCSFDITLHRLRKLLKRDDAILLTNKKVSLNTDLAWVDTTEFSRLVNAGLDMRAYSTLPALDIDALVVLSRRVLSLYRSDFLQLEEGQSWVIAARDKFRSQWLRFVVGIGQTLLHNNQTELAISLYQRGLESDLLAEELYQHLMRCYAKVGRYAEAIAVYRRCREMLSILLGISPSERTTSIYRECLTQ